MFFLPVFALLIFAVPSLQLGPMMGPVGRIDIKKLQECPNFKGQLKLQMGKNAKGQKVFNCQLNLLDDYSKKNTVLHMLLFLLITLMNLWL